METPVSLATTSPLCLAMLCRTYSDFRDKLLVNSPSAPLEVPFEASDVKLKELLPPCPELIVELRRTGCLVGDLPEVARDGEAALLLKPLKLREAICILSSTDTLNVRPVLVSRPIDPKESSSSSSSSISPGPSAPL